MGDEIVQSNRQRMKKFLQVIQDDLDRCIDFWLKYSHDEMHGGFFTCIDETGTIYDELKYGWLQGRQIWVYAKLYNEIDRFRTTQIIEAAERGAAFLMKYIKNPTTWKCYFLVTRDGKPVKVQRTIFCECFYLLAMSELARATKNPIYRDEAFVMFDKLQHWILVDDSAIGVSKLEGQIPTNSMAVPMMALCVSLQLLNMDPTCQDKLNKLIDWAIEQILAHVQRSGKCVLEHVTQDGKELPGSQGRLTVPGHVIEAGWFLLQIAQLKNNDQLKKIAIKNFIMEPFINGWDTKYGGLFYFLDVDGFSPTQLEWSQKLWWPHSEAMIAFLLAYKETMEEEYLDKFEQILNYSYGHFVDKDNGEWYGYLHQDGSHNLKFKGGPFKGCFHVPRSLLMCEKTLQELV